MLRYLSLQFFSYISLFLYQESLLIYAVQSEEESEKIAESFLKKSIDVDTFLGQYLEKRIVSFIA